MVYQNTFRNFVLRGGAQSPGMQETSGNDRSRPERTHNSHSKLQSEHESMVSSTSKLSKLASGGHEVSQVKQTATLDPMAEEINEALSFKSATNGSATDHKSE